MWFNPNLKYIDKKILLKMYKRRNPTAEELIIEEEEDFIKRFEAELIKLASEGVAFTLPAVVVDHVADTEENLSWVKSKVKRCAKEGIKEGEGLNLFKNRPTQVAAEEEGRSIVRTELMLIIQCKLNNAHHAIYRDLNQVAATRLRIGVYVFDLRGCKYPDRTISGLPINIQQIRERLQVNLNIKNPSYIDVKCDRARVEERQHHKKKMKGGYPVERETCRADVPTYPKTRATQSVLSTLHGPPGLWIGERDSPASKYPPMSNPSAQQPVLSTLHRPPGLWIGERNCSERTSAITKYNNRLQVSSNTRDSRPLSKGSVPSTLNGPPGLLIGEKNLETPSRRLQLSPKMSATQCNSQAFNTIKNRAALNPSSEQFPVLVVQEQCQSVLFNEEYVPNPSNRRVTINDSFYRDSVFNRLGSKDHSEVVGQKERKREGQPEPQGPSKRFNNSSLNEENNPKEPNIRKSQHPMTQSTRSSTKTPITSINMSSKSSASIETSIRPTHLNTSRTIQSTTDQPIRTVTSTKIPFKLVPVVPPTKNNKADIDLRIEPEIRRPLSPVPNSTNRTKVTKERPVPNNLFASSIHQVSGQFENDNFENIDERLLPVLTDNCDETSMSQPTIELKVPQRSRKETTQEHQHSRDIVYSLRQSSTTVSSLVVAETDPGSDIASNPDSSTLNGPPGLLIGEKTTMEEAELVSSSSQSSLFMSSLFKGGEPQLESQANRQLTNNSIPCESQLATKPTTGISTEILPCHITEINGSAEGVSTLDGSSGLSIGEKARKVESLASTQSIITLLELSARKLRVVQSLILPEPIDALEDRSIQQGGTNTNSHKQGTSFFEPSVANNVINDMPLDLANKQQLIQSQSMDDNTELDLDESVLLLDSTQEYSTHEGPSNLSFGESFGVIETTEYMDTEVTKILDYSLNSMTPEEVTVYEVTEYRPGPNVGQFLQQYPHIFVQLCDGEIIDAESGERIV